MDDHFAGLFSIDSEHFMIRFWEKIDNQREEI